MTQKKDILDGYFKSAKNEKVDISLESINSLIGKSGVVSSSAVSVVSKSLIKLKYIIISSATLVSVGVWLFVLTSNSEIQIDEIVVPEEYIELEEDIKIEEQRIESLSNNNEQKTSERFIIENSKAALPIRRNLSLTPLQYKSLRIIKLEDERGIPFWSAKDIMLHLDPKDSLLINKSDSIKEQNNPPGLRLETQPFFDFFYLQVYHVSIINSSNKKIYNEVSDLVYNNRKWAKTRKSNKYGFVNSKGIEVVKPEYNRIYPFYEFKGTWAKVLKKKKYGFIDTTGQEVVNPQYDKIYLFSENKEGWIMVKKNKKLGFIDKTGKEIVPAVYDKIYRFNEYKKNWAKVKLNGLYGFINEKGKVVVPAIYSTVGYFGETIEGYMRVKLRDEVLFIDSIGAKL